MAINRILAYLNDDDASVAHAIPSLLEAIDDTERLFKADGFSNYTLKTRQRLLDCLTYVIERKSIGDRMKNALSRLWITLQMADEIRIEVALDCIRAAVDELQILQHKN